MIFIFSDLQRNLLPKLHVYISLGCWVEGTETGPAKCPFSHFSLEEREWTYSKSHSKIIHSGSQTPLPTSLALLSPDPGSHLLVMTLQLEQHRQGEQGKPLSSGPHILSEWSLA